MVKVDFKLERNDNRGIYYSQTDRCLIYLPMHETIEDLYKTITHEVLHHCFEKDDDLDMDELQEESLIFQIQWADTSL